jgi:hypothetical protein
LTFRIRGEALNVERREKYTYPLKIKKPLLLLLVLTLLLGITTLFAEQSSGQITDPTVADIQTFPSDVIGIYQQMVFWMYVSPPPPSSEYFHNFTITLTKPDGGTQIMGPYTSHPAGTVPVAYTPDQLGNYSVEFNFPGEVFDVPFREYGASSDTVYFLVQEEPVVIRNPSVDVTVSPDRVGVNQMVEIGLAFSPLPPSDTDVFHNFEIYIAGAEESFGPFDSSAGGEYYFRYTPKNAGNYSVRVDYPGEWFSVGGSPYGEYYYSFVSSFVPFIVQDSPVFLPLTIRTSGSGSTNPSAGVVDYEPGDVSVIASPASGWKFSHWILDGADVGTNSEYIVPMFDSHELTAVFEEEPPNPPEEFYDLRISVSGSGTTNPVAGVQTYPSSTTLTVTASPASGWKFSHWILDGADAGTNPNYIIAMNADHELTAVFDTDGTDRNDPPTATIVSIKPSSGRENAVEGEMVGFEGSGRDSDGFVVGYRWRSSIDGLLSDSKDFSTSDLSVGTHTIYFEVQDNNGTWSTMAAQTLEVVRAVSLGVVLTVTGVGFAGSTGAGAFIYFNSKWHSTVRIKNKLQKKLKKETEKEKKEEEEEKREKDKGKPYLKLKADYPSRIMEATAYEPKLEIMNTGTRQAERIVVSSVSTPGLVLCKTSAEIKELQPGKSRSLTFPMAAKEQLRKGIYSNRFEVKSKNALSRAKIYHTRAVKIGVLSGTGLPDSSKQIKNWLRRESYVFSELYDADSLVGGLLNYDLLVLTPDVKLPKKWSRNISSFVRNGQSLCAFDRIITEEKTLLTDLLGYSGTQYKLIECDQAVIRIGENELFVPREFALGEEFQVGKSWGNFCVAGLNTGKVLAWYESLANGTKMDSSGTIPAVTTNEYGKGRVIHFNFHAEASADHIDKILKKTFDWLLS